MEEKSASCYGGAVSWYMRVSRLAVAVAIIKTRPSEGVRRFTQSLAETLKRQDEGWRSKALGLQEDLLRLRQELLLMRVQLKSRSSSGGAEVQDVVKTFLQDDTQPLRSDSGCDLEISAHSTEGPCSPLTPPHPQTFPGGTWEQNGGLLKHMRFLQCLTGLKGELRPAPCLEADEVIWDSVVQLLDSVLEVFRQAHVGQPLHHPHLLRHATQVVTQTLSGGNPDRWRSAQRFSRLEDLLKEMICLLLTSPPLNTFSVKAVLSECLLSLGGCDVIRPALLQLLMCPIIQLSQHLWDTCERSGEAPQQVDWICYENSFYVFCLLEQLGPNTDTDVNQELVTHLEHRAFCLSDEFPLFSMYMWRICGLYRTGHTQQ